MNEVIVIIILILVNGIFSMSEIAVISARKSSLSTDVKKGSKAADIDAGNRNKIAAGSDWTTGSTPAEAPLPPAG